MSVLNRVAWQNCFFIFLDLRLHWFVHDTFESELYGIHKLLKSEYKSNFIRFQENRVVSDVNIPKVPALTSCVIFKLWRYGLVQSLHQILLSSYSESGYAGTFWVPHSGY